MNGLHESRRRRSRSPAARRARRHDHDVRRPKKRASSLLDGRLPRRRRASPCSAPTARSASAPPRGSWPRPAGRRSARRDDLHRPDRLAPGAPSGFILDATPNDFVTGELERAVVACAREAKPDLILLEGQSALRNPSGPAAPSCCSPRRTGVVLQHAPGRTFFEGLERLGARIPPLEEEIELDRLLRRHARHRAEPRGLRRRRARQTARRARADARNPRVCRCDDGVRAASSRSSPERSRRRGTGVRIRSGRSSRRERWRLTPPYTVTFRRTTSVEPCSSGSRRRRQSASGRLARAGSPARRRELRARRSPRRSTCSPGADARRRARRRSARSSEADAAVARRPARPSTWRCTISRPGARPSARRPFSAAPTSACRHPSRSASSRRRERSPRREEYVGHGFRVLKVKLGRARRRSRAPAPACARRVGRRVALRADAEPGLHARRARRFLEADGAVRRSSSRAARAGARDRAACALCPEAVARALAADESAARRDDALRLVAPSRGLRHLQLKLMKCGGIRRRCASRASPRRPAST